MAYISRRAQALKIVWSQAFVSFFAAIGLYLLFDFHIAYSGFVGGLIATLPNAFFAFWVFRHSGARSAKKIVQDFYLAELLKLFFIAVLFYVAVTQLMIASPLTMFITFILVYGVFWFAPLFIDR